MVIDTSAILTILLAEPEAERVAQVIVADPKRLVIAVGSWRTLPALRTQCFIVRCGAPRHAGSH